MKSDRRREVTSSVKDNSSGEVFHGSGMRVAVGRLSREENGKSLFLSSTRSAMIDQTPVTK